MKTISSRAVTVGGLIAWIAIAPLFLGGCAPSRDSGMRMPSLLEPLARPGSSEDLESSMRQRRYGVAPRD